MRNLLTAVLLILVSCSAPQQAGGVSEAGNGVIMVSFVTPDSVPVTNAQFVISPADFRASSFAVEGALRSGGADGKSLPVSLKSGKWAVYAEHGRGAALIPFAVAENDTTRLTVVISPTGSLLCSENAVSVTIPGSPKQFALSGGRADLPAGSHSLELADSAGSASVVPAVIVPGETTTVSAEEEAVTGIYDPVMISSVYNVGFDGESACYASANGIASDRSGRRTHITAENSPMLSNWVRDVRIFGDTVLAGTDSGLIMITKSDTVLYRGGKEIPSDWVIQFADSPEGIWFAADRGVGLFQNGRVKYSYPSDVYFGGINTTALCTTPDGSVIVGGNRGLFRLKEGVWESDTLLRALNISGAVTSITGTWEDCVVSSDRSGLYQKRDGVWSKVLLPVGTAADSIHGGCGEPGSRIFGGNSGWLIGETASGFTAKKVTDKKILSVNRREDGSVWIGTMYGGVIVLPTNPFRP